MSNLTSLVKMAFARYQEDGITATFRATIRYLLRRALSRYDLGFEIGIRKVQEIDLTPYAQRSQSTSQSYDVILVTDLRFPGGSTSSSALEIATLHRAGLKTGIYHLPCLKMGNRKSPARLIDELLRSGSTDLINGYESPPHTSVLLFRHPSIFNSDCEELPPIQADEVGLIVNHPPVKFGQIEYLLPYAIRKLRAAYGREPTVHPIGPLIRTAINEAYDNTVALAEQDWVNVFDLDRFQTKRHPPSSGRAMRIGRHSRPNVEKWPTDPDAIRAAYPERMDIEIHILGGADVPKKLLGKLPSNWTVHEFGDLDPVDFLREIDVFVYFHHPDWVEAFGRVIVEAMATGLPVILPPHFEPLVGDAGIYCLPEEVSDELEKLRDPSRYMLKSRLCQETAQRKFSTDVHLKRIAALCDSTKAPEPHPVNTLA